MPDHKPQPPVDELQNWIANHAVPIRSIAADDEDFADLEPLTESIGSARVVQLGEPSHGAGSAFAAKARLVRFLHRRMGFDVLAWESGLYDLQLTQVALEAGDDAVSAAQRGIFSIWSASEECRPLFEYVRANQSGDRPLQMAGFDMQFSARGSAGRFAADLRSFVGAVRAPGTRQQATQLAKEGLEAFSRLNTYVESRASKAAEMSAAGLDGPARAKAIAAWEDAEGAQLRPKRAALDELEKATAELLTTITSHRPDFAEVHAAQAIALMERAIQNLVSYGTSMLERYRSDISDDCVSDVDGENFRDELNASNLRWLIEEAYPGRKIIVWAHNAHVMNAYYGSDWKSIYLEAHDGTMKPTGVHLAEWLGDDLYTIGFTAYEGQDGFATASTSTPVEPAKQGSMEWRLHALGMPYAFLDFRAARSDRPEAFNRPQSMRIPKYDTVTLADVTRPYDGLFFIDWMSPASRTGPS